VDEMDIGWYFDLINYEDEKKYKKAVETVLNIF